MFNPEALSVVWYVGMGSKARTPKDGYEKVCATAEWPSPRVVSNLGLSPMTTGWAHKSFGIKPTCAAHD
jgi:hypothetical protein